MKPVALTALAALMSMTLSPAWAGPASDAESALRAAYGQYRTALFATNMGDAAKSAEAVAAFAAQWQALGTELATAPQYIDDPQAPATLAAVQAVVAEAGQAVAAGELPKAHEQLERVRDEIGALHLRNGLYGFSDRMNAYHAAMEEVLAQGAADATDAAGKVRLAEKAGVLAYLAADIAAHPAPEAASAAEYAGLSQAFQTSVAAFVEAVRSGDAAAISAAIGGLKAPYSKFFVKFG